MIVLYLRVATPTQGRQYNKQHYCIARTYYCSCMHVYSCYDSWLRFAVLAIHSTIYKGYCTLQALLVLVIICGVYCLSSYVSIADSCIPAIGHISFNSIINDSYLMIFQCPCNCKRLHAFGHQIHLASPRMCVLELSNITRYVFDNVVLLFHIKDSMWVWESIYDDDSSVQHSFKWYLSEHFRD